MSWSWILPEALPNLGAPNQPLWRHNLVLVPPWRGERDVGCQKVAIVTMTIGLSPCLNGVMEVGEPAALCVCLALRGGV